MPQPRSQSRNTHLIAGRESITEFPLERLLRVEFVIHLTSRQQTTIETTIKTPFTASNARCPHTKCHADGCWHSHQSHDSNSGPVVTRAFLLGIFFLLFLFVTVTTVAVTMPFIVPCRFSNVLSHLRKFLIPTLLRRLLRNFWGGGVIVRIVVRIGRVLLTRASTLRAGFFLRHLVRWGRNTQGPATNQTGQIRENMKMKRPKYATWQSTFMNARSPCA